MSKCLKCTKPKKFGVFCYYHYLRHTYNYHKKIHNLEFTIDEFLEWGDKNAPYKTDIKKPVSLVLKRDEKVWLVKNIKWVSRSKVHKQQQRKARQGFRLCVRCKGEFPLNDDNFFRDRSRPAGFNYKCKGCCNKIQRERYNNLLEQNEIS